MGRLDYDSDKLEFRQIVLWNLKEILKITCHELRDTTKIIYHGKFSESVENEDTRYSYIQAVEHLAYILLPHFDKEIKPLYEKYIKVINAFDYQVKRMFKKTYDKITEELKDKDINDSFVIEIRLRYSKKLFVELNKLLERNDYLKSAIYGEGVDDRLEAVDEEDEEE